MLRPFTLSTMLAAAGVALASPASAQVADGGFEAQANGVATFCYSCPSGAWILYGAGFIQQDFAGWGSPPPVSPSYVTFLQGNTAYIRQTITVPSSGNYVVSYWLASRGQFGSVGGNLTLRVQLAGQTVSLVPMTSGQPFSRRLSGAVALNANTSYVLQLTGEGAGDNSLFLDSISVVPAASTTNYTYDTLGRLVTVGRTGGALDGANATYTLDPAGNRTRVLVTGAP